MWADRIVNQGDQGGLPLRIEKILIGADSGRERVSPVDQIEGLRPARRGAETGRHHRLSEQEASRKDVE